MGLDKATGSGELARRAILGESNRSTFEHATRNGKPPSGEAGKIAGYLDRAGMDEKAGGIKVLAGQESDIRYQLGCAVHQLTIRDPELARELMEHYTGPAIAYIIGRGKKQ